MKRTIFHKLFCMVCLVGLLLPITGCKRSQLIGGGGKSQKTEIERYENTVDKVFKYDFLQAKARFSMSGASLKGTIRMEHNKRFSLSVNAPLLGFEVVRVEADAQSIMLIDKMNKQYMTIGWEALQEKVGGEISIEALQALFLGQIYVPGRGVATKSDFKRLAWTLTEQGVLMGEYNQNPLYTLTYNIGAESNLLQTQLSPTGKNASVRWQYNAYRTTEDGKTLPSEESVAASIADKQLKGEMSLETPTFSKTGWTTFVPDSKYRQMEAKQLLELLKKLNK